MLLRCNNASVVITSSILRRLIPEIFAQTTQLASRQFSADSSTASKERPQGQSQSPVSSAGTTGLLSNNSEAIQLSPDARAGSVGGTASSSLGAQLAAAPHCAGQQLSASTGAADASVLNKYISQDLVSEVSGTINRLTGRRRWCVRGIEELRTHTPTLPMHIRCTWRHPTPKTYVPYQPALRVVEGYSNHLCSRLAHSLAAFIATMQQPHGLMPLLVACCSHSTAQTLISSNASRLLCWSWVTAVCQQL